MSLLRTLLAPRSSFAGDVTNPAAWMIQGLGYGSKTVSGETISPSSALTLSTWFACIRNISEDIGKLPVLLYERQERGGKKRALGHRIGALLDRPNPENTTMTVRETMTGWALGWGNGYAEIERDKSGFPVALWPIHPSRLRVHRIDGVIVYDVRSPEWEPGAVIRLSARDILHIRGFGDDPLCGLSVARMAAESLGLSKALETFGAAFFGNGATLGVTLEHPGKLSEIAQTNLRASWNKIHAGADNAHKLTILEEGMKASKVTVPPDEAQFIEARGFQIDETARWFRMPPHKIQQLARSTFGNIEHQAIEYVTDCLMPWCRRWEMEFEKKLLDDREVLKYEILHDVTVLLRGDAMSRSNFYRTMISGGIMTPNEAREMESLNPVDAAVGGVLYMQGAMSTLERIVEGPPAPTPGAFGKPAPGKETKDDEETDDAKAQAEALYPVFADAEARCRRKEEMAIANAVRKHNGTKAVFAAWVAEFYVGHTAYLIEAFTAPSTALAHAVQIRRPEFVLDSMAMQQAAIDYCSHAAQHTLTAGTPFVPEQPLADTIIAILTLENSHA